MPTSRKGNSPIGHWGVYLALVLFFGNLPQSRGQKAEFSPNMQAALADIAHLRYPQLKKRLSNERIFNRGNRVPDYLEAAALCIELFVNQNEEAFASRESELNALITRLEELPDDDPYKGVFLGEIYLAKASLQGQYQRNLKAAWLFFKAYKLLQENQEQHPEFVPNYLPWGVLNAAIGSLPDNYRNIASFLGFSGSIDKGLSLVQKAYRASVRDEEWAFYQPYFGFVFAYLQFQLEAGKQLNLEDFGLKVEQSSFYIFLQSEMLLEAGNAEGAFKLLQARPRGSAYLPFPYLDYLSGKVALSVEPRRADVFFHRYLSHSQNPNYLKSSCRYLAWYHLLRGDRDSVAYYRQAVLAKGLEFTGADQQALSEARNGFNLSLIKARLAFDGGRYEEALQLLPEEKQPLCCPQDWAACEFYYRRGRSLQALGLYPEAEEAYRKATAEELAEMSYAYGNSWLQMGQMAEERKQMRQAAKYYQICLQYRDYPFYEGVHQKAKTGLSRLP